MLNYSLDPPFACAALQVDDFNGDGYLDFAVSSGKRQEYHIALTNYGVLGGTVVFGTTSDGTFVRCVDGAPVGSCYMTASFCQSFDYAAHSSRAMPNTGTSTVTTSFAVSAVGSLESIEMPMYMN